MNEKELLGNYCLVLGLEIHLHLQTERKMFCGCSAEIWDTEPNTHTCPTCLGLPGALPVPNFEAVKKAQLVGLALGCSLNENSRFDRKHYFYPDLPKGYQISQYKQPLAVVGKLKLSSGNYAEIERVHLEEDVAKSIHKEGKTLIDFNKSGMPLVEIVTKPCFKQVEDAVDYCKQVQNIVRFLKVAEVDMEKGQMRLEVNISLRTKEMEDKNELMPYKVEVKNINSFKFMEKAVLAEIKRQREILEKGDIPSQENRGFKEGIKGTVLQRSKEEAHDYRYFPEPDIPPMEFTLEYIKGLEGELPELPAEKVERYVQEYKVSQKNAEVIVNNIGLDGTVLFEKLMKKGASPTESANLLINKIESRVLNEEQIMEMLGSKKISVAMDLSPVIEQILKANEKAVEDFKNGKEAALQFLIGSVMRETKGRASAEEVRAEIIKIIK